MAQAAAALRLLGPRIPLMLKTAAYQSLGWSEESSKWDLKTALIVTTLRSIFSESTSTITRQQNFSLTDPGVKGPIWISTVILPAPEDDIRQLLFTVIAGMTSGPQGSYTRPTLEPVEVEWTGHRAGVSTSTPVPQGLSESDKYTNLMAEVTSPVTILYFHGGAYYLMDPASHRPTVLQLVRRTGGRALSVRYRLAPQHPFPAALLDCLEAYLSLLYPPPGSLHEPVKPEHIVFAGDSAGGNMCLVLTLFLLHLQHTKQSSILWHGKQVDIPLPAGIAANSAWADQTHSLPSWHKNAKWDYLPPTQNSDIMPTHNPPMPPSCALWPSNPPRADLYCEGSMLVHPLTSPLAAKPEAWKGAPPFYMCYGEEMLGDEGKVIAQRLVRMGVKVRFEAYEAMPHVFAPILETEPVGKRCFQGWADWIKEVVERPEGVETGGVWVEAKTLKETELDVGSLIDVGDEEVWELMRKEKERRIKVFEEKFGVKADGLGDAHKQ